MRWLEAIEVTMNNIWDDLHKEAKKIIDDYYASQEKHFAEVMKLGQEIIEDPFNNVYQGPEEPTNPILEQPIDSSTLDTGLSPFENMLLGGEDE